jgi:hypothetical protein
LSHLQKELTSAKKELSEQISREATDLAELIRDEVFPKLTKHDAQIHELQESVDLKPPKALILFPTANSKTSCAQCN